MTKEDKEKIKGQVVNIKGKEYITVAGRVSLAHDANEKLSIITEPVPAEGMVVIKATVTTSKGTFTGMSAANPEKLIEKLNPYEVAETSAVGRALGFAGYGVVEGIASADEMVKAQVEQNAESSQRFQFSKSNGEAKPAHDKGAAFLDDMSWSSSKTNTQQSPATCDTCGATAVERQGINKNGKPYHGIFCSSQDTTHTRWINA